MARSTECRKQLRLTQNPLFNDPPFLPSFPRRGGWEGYRGKWILKRPPGTGMDRGRKKSQILQQQEQEGSRLEAGAAMLAWQGEGGGIIRRARTAVRRGEIFSWIYRLPLSVGRFVF